MMLILTLNFKSRTLPFLGVKKVEKYFLQIKDWYWLCILTSFWMLFEPKSWPKYFFEVFKSSQKHCLFQCFFLFKDGKSPKKCLKSTNYRLKTTTKSVLTHFQLHAAPKSWSKYTTNIVLKNSYGIWAVLFTTIDLQSGLDFLSQIEILFSFCWIWDATTTL